MTRTGQPSPAATVTVAAGGTFVALVFFTSAIAQIASLSSALDAGPGAQSWILASMSVGLAAGLLVTGALGDLYGRRMMFGIGAVVLAAGGLLGVTDASPAIFVVARVIQGLGAAAVISCGLGLIAQVRPTGPDRVRATAVWGSSVGAGIAIGPILVTLVDRGLGWRWPYLILALLALVLAALTLALTPADPPRGRGSVDVPGAVLIGVSTSLLLSGLVTGRAGWNRALPWTLLLAAVVAMGAFGWVQARKAARGGRPLLDPALFRRPDFVGATVAGLATGTGVIAAMSFAPALVGRGLGGSAVEAALLLGLWSVTSVPVALLARRLPLGGTAQLVLGLSVTAVGLLALTGIHDGSGFGRLVPGLVVAGIGSGVLNAALGRMAVASVPPALAAMGSGANNTARYLGSAIGVTAVSVLVGTEPAGIFTGWTHAMWFTAGVSVLGAVAVLACLGWARRGAVAGLAQGGGAEQLSPTTGSG